MSDALENTYQVTPAYSLEIGPGDSPAGRKYDGRRWVLLDTMKERLNEQCRNIGGGATYLVCRWGHDRILMPDNTFDLVYASHVLEHVPWFKVEDALREVWRVLKPGGVFEVWVPNLEYLIYMLQRNDGIPDGWRVHNPAGDFWKWFNGRLFYGAGDGEDSWHRCAFTPRILLHVLMCAGFGDCEIINGELPRGVDHGEFGLGVRCRKYTVHEKFADSQAHPQIPT